MKNSNQKFMQMAIDEARKSSEALKCGVVIVKDEKLIAKTYNSQHKDNDSAAHAEVKAVGVAGKKLGNKNLTGCVAYCTCEPCVMCLSVLSFAKIDKLFFGLSLKKISPINKRIDIDIDTFLSKSPHKFEVIKTFMEEECKSLL